MATTAAVKVPSAVKITVVRVRRLCQHVRACMRACVRAKREGTLDGPLLAAHDSGSWY